MADVNKIDAATVRQLAALNGLDLSIDRAADLVAPLQLLLHADKQISALLPPTLPPILPGVGLPWGEAYDEAD